MIYFFNKIERDIDNEVFWVSIFVTSHSGIVQWGNGGEGKIQKHKKNEEHRSEKNKAKQFDLGNKNYFYFCPYTLMHVKQCKRIQTGLSDC